MSSLQQLLDDGKLTPDQAKDYEIGIYRGDTFKSLCIAELGLVTGELYVREQQAQLLILHNLRLKLEMLSVPEVLFIEDSHDTEPWHAEHFSELPMIKKYKQEAGEPWHHSLRERFEADKAVKLYFKGKAWSEKTMQILKLAYGI